MGRHNITNIHSVYIFHVRTHTKDKILTVIKLSTDNSGMLLVCSWSIQWFSTIFLLTTNGM